MIRIPGCFVCLLVTSLLVTVGSNAALARPAVRRSPTDILTEANNQYSYGRYKRVVRLLRPLVERGLFKSRADRVEALRLYGVCLFLTGRKAAARQMFQTLVSLDSKVRLDPRLVQPEVVAAFEKIRKIRISKARHEARRALRRRYMILNFLPPAGQFQNRQWRKAVVILSLEVGFLAANLATYFVLRSNRLRQPDGTYIERDVDGNVVEDRRKLARALMGINYASFGLLLGTILYGMVDGVVYHQRHKKRTMRFLNDSAMLYPFSTPGGAGLGFALSF